MKQRAFGYVKVAMIPLLFGILYLVIRGARNEPSVVLTAPTNATPAISPAKGEQTQDTKESELSVKPQWPKFTFSELANVDPFDRRMIFPDPLAKALPTDPNDSEKQLLVGSNRPLSASLLESLKIHAIFQSPQGIAALVDERIIHIGDRLKDGTQVIGITPEQLIVESPTAH